MPKVTKVFSLLCDSKELHKQLTLLTAAISSNPVLPILESVLMTVPDGEENVVLQGTDLEIQLRLNTDYTVRDGDMPVGGVAFPIKLVKDILAKLAQQPLVLEFFSNYTAGITSAHGRYEFPYESGKDYPEFSSKAEGELPTNPRQYAIMAGKLLEAFDNTLWAVSNDELRPAMCGIFFNVEHFPEVNVVATNAHKMVVHRHVFEVVGPEPKLEDGEIVDRSRRSFVLPTKAVRLIQKTMKAKSAVDVNIQFDGAAVTVTHQGMIIMARTVDARYPDYSAVIPVQHDQFMTVNADDLKNAASRLKDFANNHTKQGKFTIKEKTLVLEAADTDMKKGGSEQLRCQFDGAEYFEIGFNLEYLEETLAVLSGHEAKFYMTTATRAILVKPEDSKDAGVYLPPVTMLLMPVMLSN